MPGCVVVVFAGVEDAWLGVIDIRRQRLGDALLVKVDARYGGCQFVGVANGLRECGTVCLDRRVEQLQLGQAGGFDAIGVGDIDVHRIVVGAARIDKTLIDLGYCQRRKVAGALCLINDQR